MFTVERILNGILVRILRYKRLVRSRIASLKPFIKIGSGTQLESNVRIETRAGGSITIGKDCYLSEGVQIITWGGEVEIGDNCTLNPYTIVYGQGGTKIGNGVRIAAHCVIVPSNHIFADTELPIYKQGLTMEGITIEDDVWLGSGVKILDGVNVGRGCVVGANSVVTKVLEPYGVYVGVPAKKLKSRL